MKLASYRWISCSNIRRKNRTPNDAISRLYKSSKQMKLARKFRAKNNELPYTNSASKVEMSCNEQPYVRTQLAIATLANCDPATEKTDDGALSEMVTGIPFIANLPHMAVRANHLVLKPDLKKVGIIMNKKYREYNTMYCLLYTSPSPRD